MQQLKTITLIEEIPTDGHSPLKFLCDDFNIYYCKYRSGNSLKREEIDCLFYEIVCNNLLKALGITSPDLAIIEISPGSFITKQLSVHKRHCRPGQLYLGSKEIPFAETIQKLHAVNNKREFKRLLNPYDLIKICMFDFWVDNRDRGKNDNYNLLSVQEEDKLNIVPFDHAFCFGGLDNLRTFNPLLPYSENNRLVKSLYFMKALAYFDKQKACEVIKNFLSLQYNEIELIISDSYNSCPKEWEIPPALVKRTSEFLTNIARRVQFENILLSLFK